MRSNARLLLLLVGHLLGAGAAEAAIFHVEILDDGADAVRGDGRCEALYPDPRLGPYRLCTLRAAVQEANAMAGPDAVHLPAGEFVLDDSLGPIRVEDDLVVRGLGPEDTAIRGLSGFDALFEVGLGSAPPVESVEFQRLTLERAPVGIYTHAQELRVVGSVIRDIRAVAIFGDSPQLTLLDSELLRSDRGIQNYGTVTLEDSRIAEIGPSGDAVLANTLFAIRTTFEDNLIDSGAFVAFVLEDALIWGSTFTGNTASAILYHGIGELWTVNSTISGNRGIGRAADSVVRSEGGSAALFFTTIAENDMAGLLAAAGATPNLRLEHTVVAGQLEGDCAGAWNVRSQYSSDQDGSCGLVDPTDLPATDPMLLPLANNGGPTLTHALAGASPLRDAGLADCTSSAPLGMAATDQRGLARPGGTACDIGAFEALAGACGLGFEVVPALVLVGRIRGRTKRRRRCSDQAPAPASESVSARATARSRTPA